MLIIHYAIMAIVFCVGRCCCCLLVSMVVSDVLDGVGTEFVLLNVVCSNVNGGSAIKVDECSARMAIQVVRVKQ